ncbi:MAG: metallo-beta-lactamase family protein [Oleiphilaceae bacterium]
MTQCEGINYTHRIPITADIDICSQDAGHILGSFIIQVFINENGQEKKLVFSGDLGNSYAALLKDPKVVKEADILLLESTYSDRNHQSMGETLGEFEAMAKGCDKSLHNFLSNLHFSISTEESIELNKVEKGNIIIVGGGMCNGG